MVIQGRLLEALKSKKLILFSGAGVGQAAGLFGTAQLRDYIYEKANNLNYQGSSDQSFERLAADLQNNPAFGREWLTRTVSEYFCKPASYTNLECHTKLLMLNCLDSIFTTNYDIAFEQAAARAMLDIRVRALDTVSGATAQTPKDTINCYKLHGCADYVTKSPQHAHPLVLSRKDWQIATENRKEVLKELTTKVNSGCVVIFAGFNLSNGDNSDIARAVFEGNGDVLRSDHWQSNSCYALVINPSEDDKKTFMEDYSCEVIHGDFSTFVSEIEAACKSLEKSEFAINDNTSHINLTVLNCTEKFSKVFWDEISDSFFIWHNQTLAEAIKEKCNLDNWHEPPSIKMLTNNRYIERDILSKVINESIKAIKEISKHKRNYVISITGERGTGKSVILLQLAKYCYETLKQPIIFLKEDAFLEVQSKNENSLSIQGWEAKSLDTILSPFFDSAESVVPILIADNQPHRKLKAIQLAGYLSNHGKPCLLIISEYGSSENIDLSNKKINIPSLLSNTEIDRLFDKLSVDRPAILEKRDVLLYSAKQEKDILIIMYEWLDENFRPFTRIISDTASQISKSNILRQVYILIATFHVAGYKPSLSLIIRAADYPADNVLTSLKNGDFGLRLSSDAMVLYRHSLISSRLLAEMGVTTLDQLKAIISCIKKGSASDVRFFKDFLDYLFNLGNPSFTVSDIEAIKETTEQNTVFNSEWDLHHKYAAYLAHDSNDIAYYQEARRYCDKALSLAVDDSNRSSIYHTLGNIEYKQYRICYDKNPELAKGCFDRAVEKFELSKQLRSYQTEHAYVTHIDFINFQLDKIDTNESNYEKKVIELTASKFATFWEALKVVDKDRQYYLSDRFKREKALLWNELPENIREHIKENAHQLKPNKILFDCYIDQCLKEQSQKTREKINELYNLHEKNLDPDILIPLMEGMKRAFLLSAGSRSDILRSIASELFDPESPIANLTRARGIRLLAIDSFISGQFDYLAKHVLKNAATLYQEIRPRFLEFEYILPHEYYSSTGVNDKSALKLFLDHGSNCFYNVKLAEKIELIFNRRSNAAQQNVPKFTYLSTPRFGDFLLKVPTAEIISNRNSFTAKCTVQYSAFGMSGNLLKPST